MNCQGEVSDNLSFPGFECWLGFEGHAGIFLGSSVILDLWSLLTFSELRLKDDCPAFPKICKKRFFTDFELLQFEMFPDESGVVTSCAAGWVDKLTKPLTDGLYFGVDRNPRHFYNFFSSEFEWIGADLNSDTNPPLLDEFGVVTSCVTG